MTVTDDIIRDYIRVRLNGPEKVIADMRREFPSPTAQPRPARIECHNQS
jgi:hypothetical protein